MIDWMGISYEIMKGSISKEANKVNCGQRQQRLDCIERLQIPL